MLLNDLLDKPLAPWMNGSGDDADVVLTSRVRLARNLTDMPFPNRASADQLAGVVNEMRATVQDLSAQGGHDYMLVELDQLSALNRYALVEKHIVSPALAQDPEHRALIVRNDEAVSIMINEEDHLRIQSMMAGLNLTETLHIAGSVDDTIESKHDIAFSEQMGYLTACPTNLGTGLRASVMLHLPALVLTRQISRLFNAFTQLGLAIRGLYGEGTEASGNIFQISNQLTLGYSEQGIIDNLNSVARQIVENERRARGLLFEQSLDILGDRVWRAYGILKYARSITGEEALSLLSEVRLGIDLNIIDQVPARVFNELLVTTGPSFLQKMAGENEVAAAEQDKLRAQVIRDTFIREQGGSHNV
jgi:protein arginine kinase